MISGRLTVTSRNAHTAVCGKAVMGEIPIKGASKWGVTV